MVGVWKNNYHKKISFVNISPVVIDASIISVGAISSFHDIDFRSDQTCEEYITRQKKLIKQEVHEGR